MLYFYFKKIYTTFLNEFLSKGHLLSNTKTMRPTLESNNDELARKDG